jgi:hypothetical protein
VQTSITEFQRVRRAGRSRARDLVPEAPASAKSCRPPVGKTKLRPCHTELTFLGPEEAAECGERPGPAVRLCKRPREEGRLVRVDTPEASMIVARGLAHTRRIRLRNVGSAR